MNPKPGEAVEGIGVHVRLPAPLWKRVKMAALQRDTTAQAVVIMALEKALAAEGR